MKHFILILIGCLLLAVEPISSQVLPAPDMATEDLKKVHDLIAARGNAQLSSEQFLKFAEQFSEIADRYPNEWVPTYYTGLMAIGSVFEESSLTMTKEGINAQCDRTEKIMERCEELGAPEDAVLVIRALISFGRIRGGASLAISNFIARAALEEAREINPLNPRIYSLLGQGVYFSPIRVGGGPPQAKAYFETALALFADEKPAYGTPEYLLPHWGQPRAERYLSRCAKGQLIVYDERMKEERYETTCY